MLEADVSLTRRRVSRMSAYGCRIAFSWSTIQLRTDGMQRLRARVNHVALRSTECVGVPAIIRYDFNVRVRKRPLAMEKIRLTFILRTSFRIPDV